MDEVTFLRRPPHPTEVPKKPIDVKVVTGLIGIFRKKAIREILWRRHADLKGKG